MASSWDVASVGWTMTVLGWLLAPIIGSLPPKILCYLGFDASQKLLELEIRISLELKNTLEAVDEQRMMQRGKKPKSEVAALDKMAALLRHAREEAEHILDDHHEIELYRNRFPHRLCHAVTTCIALCKSNFTRVDTVRAARHLLQRAGYPISDVASGSEIVPVATGAAASVEPDPATTVSDSSGPWLSCLCTSLDFFGNCCKSLYSWFVHVFEAACFYRNWSYNVVGITSYQENATALDFALTAISRRKLKNKIEKVENTISEVKKSLLSVASNSTPDHIANENRSKIRTASNRKVFGREGLRDSVMARLREIPHDDAPSTSTSMCYSVIGIYGVAGSGKTTFAQYIRDYIKKECKEKLFDTTMCIHVSGNFSVDDIFHEMLKDITAERHCSVSDHEELEEKLKKELHDKHFLLILDDLWVKSKNDPQLEELIYPLNVGLKGSKILVTARTKVAATALCDHEPIEMPDLDENQYLKMFMHYALGGISVADEEEFKKAGRVIAKKLHKSPIAGVIVAGWLGAN